MSRAELQASLERLRAELATLGTEAEDTRTRLTALVDEVERELEQLGETGDHASILDKLQHQVEAFEVEHPRITNILNDIMVTLANLGI